MDFDTFVLDSSILGMLVFSSKHNSLFTQWLGNLDLENDVLVIPEIIDYELRRELIRLGHNRSINTLDELKEDFIYLPLDTSSMLIASKLWAKARNEGYQTATNHSLDIDVILAAQNIRLIEDGFNAVIVTENIKHLSRYTNAMNWELL